MPELPEVETIRRQLGEVIIGKKICRVEVLEPKMFIGETEKIIGKKIISVNRQAKVLQIIFDDKTALFIHFKLNGQLFLDAGKVAFDARFTRAILYLSDGGNIRFNDSRKFAWMKVVENYQENLEVMEPFKKNFTLENFKKVLSSTRRPVKIVLMDQTKIGGIGNIYANESLFKARVSPFRAANSLIDEEVGRLYKAIPQILHKAIECKGSSGKDEWYRQLNGQLGCYQDHFLVYQKDKQLCPGSCGGKIERIKQGGRSTFYCPVCQK